MPPIPPEPSHMSKMRWRETPRAELMEPPPQLAEVTTPAFLGPSRSSHAPKIAAEEPRKTKNSVNIQPNVLIFQSQVVVNRLSTRLWSAGQGTGLVIPMALLSGSQ